MSSNFLIAFNLAQFNTFVLCLTYKACDPEIHYKYHTTFVQSIAPQIGWIVYLNFNTELFEYYKISHYYVSCSMPLIYNCNCEYRFKNLPMEVIFVAILNYVSTS